MAPSKSALPALSPDGNLSRYLEQIRSFPMLEPEQEYMLAKSWKDRGDVDAALVAAPARRARGLPLHAVVVADVQRLEGARAVVAGREDLDPDLPPRADAPAEAVGGAPCGARTRRSGGR